MENKEVLTWEMLEALKNDTAKNIIKQQIQIKEYINLYKDKIAKDNDLKETLIGLTNTIMDLVNDARLISLRHATEVKTVEKDGYETKVGITFKKGEVDENSDEYFDYLKTYQGYISINEKLAHIVSMAYIDIFSKLKSDEVVNELKNIHQNGVSNLEKVTKEAIENGNKQSESRD